MSKVLVTGGLGYLGSHAVIELMSCGHEVTIVDDLTNSTTSVLSNIASIAGTTPEFHELSVCDAIALSDLMCEGNFTAALHFAGLKSVSESVTSPLDYYTTNVCGSLNLVRAMEASGTRKLVFSSTAAVYGSASKMPVTEHSANLAPLSPYGKTKLAVERLLQDLCDSDGRWSVSVLRYFNPVGSHPSGLIGETPVNVPDNLFPYISQVAAGHRPYLKIYGDDFATPDGTGVRDYIHVQDLALGHINALNQALSNEGLHCWNLGTGTGHSVFDVVKAFERITGEEIPFRIVPRRPGDLAKCYANTDKANNELGWVAELSLDEMVRDAWRWQQRLSSS